MRDPDRDTEKAAVPVQPEKTGKRQETAPQKPPIQEEKSRIRREIRRGRRELSREDKTEMDRKIRGCLWELLTALRADIPLKTQGSPFAEGKPEQGCSGAVYLYASLEGEVDTWELIRLLWERKIPVALPRVEETEIHFYLVEGSGDVAPGSMGILEPKADCPAAADPRAPVVTPGLAFSRQGDRIGYGGGFYDRFFEREPEHPRIGVAYPFQVMEELPAEETDRKLSWLVTPEGICAPEREMHGSEPSDSKWEEGTWN